MNLPSFINEWDVSLFKLIHSEWAHPFLDTLMPHLRNPLTWIPIYAFLLYFMWTRYKMDGLYWCIIFIVTFGICDVTAASILKPIFGRLRPCNDPSLMEGIRNLVHCGVGKSFPSAHSSNHFGLSFFIIFTIGQLHKWMRPLALLWACLVVYAQVYVGVHFPLDILGGLLLGLIVATFTSYLFKKNVSLSSNS